jgi:hypothetical protein
MLRRMVFLCVVVGLPGPRALLVNYWEVFFFTSPVMRFRDLCMPGYLFLQAL